MMLLKNISSNKKYFIFGVLSLWSIFSLFAVLPIYTHNKMGQFTSAVAIVEQLLVLVPAYRLFNFAAGRDKKLLLWFFFG